MFLLLLREMTSKAQKLIITYIVCLPNIFIFTDLMLWPSSVDICRSVCQCNSIRCLDETSKIQSEKYQCNVRRREASSKEKNGRSEYVMAHNRNLSCANQYTEIITIDSPAEQTRKKWNNGLQRLRISRCLKFHKVMKNASLWIHCKVVH